MKFFLGVIGFIIVVFFLLGLKSQKGKAPGLINGKLKEPGAAPNCVSSEDDVQPERKVAPLTSSRDQIIAAIHETGGTITTDSKTYISATYMSSLFKFVDDVELRPAGDNLWHIRSASRVGYSDRGVNRKRVDAIRAAIK